MKNHYSQAHHLFKMHHKIKLQLDAICQEAGDMNVEEFMQVYKSLEQEQYKLAKPTPSGIELKYLLKNLPFNKENFELLKEQLKYRNIDES